MASSMILDKQLWEVASDEHIEDWQHLYTILQWI